MVQGPTVHHLGLGAASGAGSEPPLRPQGPVGLVGRALLLSAVRFCRDVVSLSLRFLICTEDEGPLPSPLRGQCWHDHLYGWCPWSLADSLQGLLLWQERVRGRWGTSDAQRGADTLQELRAEVMTSFPLPCEVAS